MDQFCRDLRVGFWLAAAVTAAGSLHVVVRLEPGWGFTPGGETFPAMAVVVFRTGVWGVRVAGADLAHRVGVWSAASHYAGIIIATAGPLMLAHVYVVARRGPPEHPTKLLANAQAEWLAAKGGQHGWTAAKSALDAQRLANHGNLVVAVYREPNPERPGHVAIVRPSPKPDARVRVEGPQIIQAGATNATSTTLAEGFKHHRGAWPSGVRFYVHAVHLK